MFSSPILLTSSMAIYSTPENVLLIKTEGIHPTLLLKFFIWTSEENNLVKMI